MDDPWTILRRGGVPIGGPPAVSGPAATPEALAAAAHQAIASVATLTGREREALLAWLCAWWSHYPGAFRAAFGQDYRTVATPLMREDDDHGRHIKLRRIALAGLAHLL